MDFQNANLLNARLNKISGNLLPMIGDGSLFSVEWKIYSAITLLIDIILISGIIPGMLLMPRDKALQNGADTAVGIIEVVFLLTQLQMNRDLVTQLVHKLNEILSIEDKTMETIVRSTLTPLEFPLKFYYRAGLGATLIWCLMPFMMIFQKKYFLYEDYIIPLALWKQPFSMELFILGNCIVFIGALTVFTKKVAMNTYIINLVLLVTAQYRYIAVKLTTVFREDVSQNQRNEFVKKYSTVDSSAILKIKALCRHHIAVIQMTLTLKKLLSTNMSLIYLTNVFILSFLDIMLISAIISSAFLEIVMILVYLAGQLLQLYILCFCINQLMEASVEVTDKAFHEEWYQYGSSLKHIFRMMIITKNLDCKLSVSEMFSLSLSSFMSILNQSYSVALVFLRMAS